MDEKTNVMRILEQKKIKHETHSYVGTGAVSGSEVASALSQNPKRVFKTLVTVGKSKNNYVFVIPVEKELNLKKAAKIVGEKSIDMLKSKDLLSLTGYIHGGCSPIFLKLLQIFQLKIMTRLYLVLEKLDIKQKCLFLSFQK